jgi:hypothetical protein
MKLKSVFTILLLIFLLVNVVSQEEEKVISSYLFPEFSMGRVRLKTGIVKESKLNYNILTEEMIFDSNGTKLAFANPELIDTVYILNRKFVQFEKMFYELLEKLPVSLFQRHFCRVIPPGKKSAFGGTSETSSIETTSYLFTSTGKYEMKLPEDYRIEPDSEYLLKKGDTLNKVTSVNQVIKCFPDKKLEIKEFVKKNKTDLREEDDIRTLVRFCNK